MRKKLMSLLLIGTMTTLLFTGCGGGSSEKETSKSNTQPEHIRLKTLTAEQLRLVSGGMNTGTAITRH